jgi:hypothetical protein
MFASGVSASAQQSIASFQGQQLQKVQQQFQSLASEFQSGSLSATETTALSSQSLPASATTTAQTMDPLAGATGGPAQYHRIQIRMEPGSSNTSSQSLDPFGSNLDSVNPLSAQQAYSTLGQNLDSSLGTDLTTAVTQAQTSTLSLTV